MNSRRKTNVAHAEDRTRTGDDIQQKVAFEDRDAKTKVLLLGDDAWPFPIPLVKKRCGWRFDTVAGGEEVTNRRIGTNELLTLAPLHAVVDAQKDYFKGRHEGRTKAYAQRVISQPACIGRRRRANPKAPSVLSSLMRRSRDTNSRAARASPITATTSACSTRRAPAHRAERRAASTTRAR